MKARIKATGTIVEVEGLFDVGTAPCPLSLLIHFNLINDYNYGKSIYNKVCLNRRY